MNRNFNRQMKSPPSVVVLNELSERQYLAPHRPLAEVLTAIAAKHGLTMTSVRAAATECRLDLPRSIGRCKRAELESLARRIRRACRRESLARRVAL